MKQMSDKHSRGKPVVMVGTFPPPVHGMSLVNAAVKKYFSDNGIETCIIDTSAWDLNRSIFARLSRISAILRGLVSLLLHKDAYRAVLYMGVSGGAGKVYDIVYLLLARLKGMQIYLHHHSFAYIDSRSTLASVLFFTAGKGGTHIVLCNDMQNLLKERYKTVNTVKVITNSVWIAGAENYHESDRKMTTLGYLGNISIAKGIVEYLALAEHIAALNLPLRLLLAGPFEDKNAQQLVEESMQSHSVIEYIGPVYGREKDLFYESIDVLVFPSKYRNEADPLVIHEALTRRVLVISTARGCIPELLQHDNDLCIGHDDDFVTQFMAILQKWLSSPELYKSCRDNTWQKYTRLIDESKKNLNLLLDKIKNHCDNHAAEY